MFLVLVDIYDWGIFPFLIILNIYTNLCFIYAIYKMFIEGQFVKIDTFNQRLHLIANNSTAIIKSFKKKIIHNI